MHFISKESYGYGQHRNVLHYSVQKQYLPVRGPKLPVFKGGSIWPRMGRCNISGLPIPTVPRLHQTKVYMKMKLSVWRDQKCIGLDGAETVPTSAGPRTTPFHEWQYRADMEISNNSVLPIPMVSRLHQSNVYIKRKVSVWRAQKCIALVDAETVLTSAGLQTTLFHGWQYRADNGNM